MQYVIHTAGFVDDVMIRPAARQRRRRQGVYTYSKWFIRYNIAGEVWHLRLCAVCNTRQSPGASRRRPRRIIRQWSYLYLRHYGRTWYHPQNRKYIIYCTVVRRGPSHARPGVTRTDDFVKFGHAVFEICERTDKQTDRHVHRNTSHPPEGEVLSRLR